MQPEVSRRAIQKAPPNPTASRKTILFRLGAQVCPRQVRLRACGKRGANSPVYVRKPDGALESSVVGASSRCALGKWLEDGGQKYASLPEYKNLVEEHARFHKIAAGVIRTADSSSIIDHEQAFGPQSGYGIASRKVGGAIKDLEKKSPSSRASPSRSAK